MIKTSILLLSLISGAQSKPPSAPPTPVAGELIKEYPSPNGLVEVCEILSPIPGGVFSKGDIKKEGKLCAIDIYDSENIGLCPKTWSTSAAVMAHNISVLKTTADKYEAANCDGKSRPKGVKREFKFKITMNQKDTSGTFSQASLMYYHMSRLLDTSVGVPPAVYREIDAKEIAKRVGNKGIKNAAGAMNKAAWKNLVAASTNPKVLPANSALTPDGKLFFGALLDDKGERYGTEINSARTAKGYEGQNKEFQTTAGFRALRVDADLKTAITKGLATAKADAKLKKDLVNVSDLQMMFWMRELTELTTLDYIFSQQDRVGNIDYEWKWYYVAGGKVESMDEESELPRASMAKIPVPKAIESMSPVLVQRTHIGDNDAGGRVAYANWTKKTGMLDKVFHYSAKFYTRLHNVNENLQSKGDIYEYFANEYGLTDGEIKQVVTNTKLAMDIARAQCKAGKLRFDLDSPKQSLIDGFVEHKVDCDSPSFED